MGRTLKYCTHLKTLRKNVICCGLTVKATDRFSMDCKCFHITHRCPTFILIKCIVLRHSLLVRCAHTHLIDSALNNDLSILTGCLRHTLRECLFVVCSTIHWRTAEAPGEKFLKICGIFDLNVRSSPFRRILFMDSGKVPGPEKVKTFFWRSMLI